MKVLADAHVSRSMVAFLEQLGHDVLSAGRLAPRLPDREIMRIAAEQGRVILTADKDFGGLVFLEGLPAEGVILIRFTVPSESERVDLLRKYWPVIEASVKGHFVVVTDRAVRRTPLT